MQDTPIKIQVPDSWAEVTIGQFQEITEIDKDLHPIQRSIELIAILTDQDPDIIKHLDTSNLVKIAAHLSWLEKIPEDAVYKPIITIDGESYGFLSRLTELTAGEWFDLEAYVEAYDTNLHKILAILYRPLVVAYNDRDRLLEPYDSISADHRAELFKQKANIADTYGAAVFFYLIAQNCTGTIKDYLETQAKEMKMKNFMESLPKRKRNALLRKKRIRNVLRSGCGMVFRMFWPKETSRRWMKFLKLTSS